MNYLENAKEVFKIEIEGVEHIKNGLNDNFNLAVDTILKGEGRVVITGMGKSGLVGQKIAATFASTGTRSFFMHPGEAYHGDLGMISPSDVIIAISNSGETEEIIKLISFFQDNKNKIISMTAKEESTLAKYSDYFLNISVPKEACPLKLAPTSSTTATMAMGDALAVCLMKARNFKAENFARFHPGGNLGRKLLVKVSDVMRSKDLPIVQKEENFAAVLDSIARGRMGITVVQSGDEVIGVITDGDIRRVITNEKDLALSKKAIDFYTKNPKTISYNKKIVEAEKIMQEHRITTILVFDGIKLVGILDRYNC